MSSGGGSKYLTPCRSFGLKRTNKNSHTTRASSEGGKVVNSPFTSPLIVTTPKTAPCVEKKLPSSKDSLWSTPLINKSSLKIGLSKPSGKLKTRLLQPKALLNKGASSRPSGCSDVHKLGTCVDDSSKSTSCNDERPILDLKCCDKSSTHKIIIVKSSKTEDENEECLKTLPKKNSELIVCTSISVPGCAYPEDGSTLSKSSHQASNLPNVRSTSSNPELRVCLTDISANVSATYRVNDDSTKITSEKCAVETIKDGFFGWDSDGIAAFSLNSTLENYKTFLENQAVGQNKPCSTSSKDSVHRDGCISDGPFSEDMAASCNYNTKPGSYRFLESEVSKANSNKRQRGSNEKSSDAKPDQTKDYQSSALYDTEMEDGSEEEWDVSTTQSHVQIRNAKQKRMGKLSLSKQTGPAMSNNCSTEGITVQPVNIVESIDYRPDSEVQFGTHDNPSGSDERLEKDIRKWLEGGQRVIQEIIEEVRLRNDREMTVMEVLVEQGVDPNLVGYDPQTDEFLTFDTFMFRNNLR